MIISSPMNNGGILHPAHDTRWIDEATVLAGSYLLLQKGFTGQTYFSRGFIASQALNDELSFEFYLDSGTFDFKVLGNTELANGIIEWKLNDVVIVASQDWLGGVVWNVLKTESGVVIPTPGVQVLKGKVIGTSGSVYRIPLTKLWFEKTA